VSVDCYAGERRVWHSGSISTYKAHVWLYPDAGFGIFAALPGPQRYDTTNVFFDLMHAISDVVVFGIRRPAAVEYSRPTPSPDTVVRGHIPPHPLTDYAGTYVGQWPEMNATVSQDRDILLLTLGRMLTAELRSYNCSRNEFHAVIGGRLWWVTDTISVRFWSSTPGGRPDIVELPLEMSVERRYYRFMRPGLTLSDDLTTTVLDRDNSTCSAACFTGPHVWMFLPVVFQLFSF